MSRIGKRLIAIPDGVTVNLDGQQIAAKGPKGELSIVLVKEVTAEVGDDGITIGSKEDSKRARSMWGLTRSLVSNVITGVTEGFTKTLEINGVGYRAQVQGKNLQLTLGLSHDVAYAIPDGIKIECTKPTEIVVSGIERQKVGQVAAEIRRYRPPEPYKGKGIRYAGEYVFRKEGKKK